MPGHTLGHAIEPHPHLDPGRRQFGKNDQIEVFLPAENVTISAI